MPVIKYQLSRAQFFAMEQQMRMDFLAQCVGADCTFKSEQDEEGRIVVQLGLPKKKMLDEPA